MKKTYQNPTTIVVRVELHRMVAASQLGFGDSVDSAAGAESRRRGGSAWDDEYEDE